MEPIKLLIHGASGRVGQVLINNLYRFSDVRIVAAVDLKAANDTLKLGDGSWIPFSQELEKMIISTSPQVIVDFSLAPATIPAVRLASKYKINMVIGTTGLCADNLAEIRQLTEAAKICVIVASNFALGGILMMYFAKLAARYMDSAEIIELHHDLKLDAPSGTAISTAQAMIEYRGRPFNQPVDADKDYPSRGLKYGGIPVHSVRLPGLMAHQEVILGGMGQTLTIRHDTINRECYVPGVLLAIKESVKRQGFIQGLEQIMDF